MPLSITKLEKLLNNSGFVVKSIFTIEEQAAYLDIFNISTADNFMLYIPSRYEISVNENYTNEKGNVFPLKYIDEKEFVSKMDEYELDKEYNKIDTYLSPDKENTRDMEKALKENYEKDVEILY